MKKFFNETFSGWGCEGKNGTAIGLEGYSYSDAERIKASVIDSLKGSSKIHEIRVNIEQMPNGNFCVHNTSVYDAD